MLQYALLDLLVFGPLISGLYLLVMVVGLLAFTVVADDGNSLKEGNGIGAFVAGPVAIWIFIHFGLKPGRCAYLWQTMSKHLSTLLILIALLLTGCAGTNHSCPAYGNPNRPETGGSHSRKVHYNSQGKKVYTQRY